MLTKAPFHIIYHQFTVNSFNTENHTADTNKVSEREREREREREGEIKKEEKTGLNLVG